jgi:hypothetical protein
MIFEDLFWSKRGGVACGPHAPDQQSDRWTAEAWCQIPPEEHTRHGLTYQCPQCAPDGRTHRHVRAADQQVEP